MNNKGLLEHTNDAIQDSKNIMGLVNQIRELQRKEENMLRLPLSDDTKKAISEDILKAVNELKERIHNAVDTL